MGQRIQGVSCGGLVGEKPQIPHFEVNEYCAEMPLFYVIDTCVMQLKLPLRIMVLKTAAIAYFAMN